MTKSASAIQNDEWKMRFGMLMPIKFAELLPDSRQRAAAQVALVAKLAQSSAALGPESIERLDLAALAKELEIPNDKLVDFKKAIVQIAEIAGNPDLTQRALKDNPFTPRRSPAHGSPH